MKNFFWFFFCIFENFFWLTEGFYYGKKLNTTNRQD